MCPTCQGIVKIVALNLDKALDMNKSLNDGAILLSGYKVGTYLWKSYTTTGYFDNDKKIKDYSKEEFDNYVDKHRIIYCSKTLRTALKSEKIMLFRLRKC